MRRRGTAPRPAGTEVAAAGAEVDGRWNWGAEEVGWGREDVVVVVVVVCDYYY